MSDPKVISIYGPPGSGKTNILCDMLVRAVERLGDPRKVAAVTYTRAAANELRARAAQRLGMHGTQEMLQQELPYVGTIHSLAYRLIGKPKMVEDGMFQAHRDGVPFKKSSYFADDTKMPDAWADAADETTLALRLASNASHRQSLLQEALKTLPWETLSISTSPEKILQIAKEYREWKKSKHLTDYEDLLMAGRLYQLPVRFLAIDEAQDNSKLMWSVIDAWQRGTDITVSCGDPWQALFSYSGADPLLFRQRPGGWVSLGKSYRLNPASVDYAKRVLNSAGWSDPLIDTLESIVSDDEYQRRRDAPIQSVLHLARTHNLLRQIERSFMETGTPYCILHGKSPLDQWSGLVYRMLARAQSGDAVEAGSLLEALKKAKNLTGQLPTLVDALKAKPPDYQVSDRWLRETVGIQPTVFMGALPFANYFHKIVRRNGQNALFERPTVSLSTIHGAKGREADEVILSSDWGWIPSRAMTDPIYLKQEACVAFVGVSRHRVKLRVEGPTVVHRSTEYPFP